MRRVISNYMMQWAVVGNMAVVLVSNGPEAWAQAESPGSATDKAQTEQELREQLKGNLQDREQLLQKLEGITKQREEALPPSARPKTVTERPAPQHPEATPEYDLADTRIIDQRVEVRPEGVTLSSTTRSEHESQSTSHLRESLESLPGIVVRQEHGAREVNLSIRGSGAKTGCCVRNIKVYEDGISVTQPDGLSRSEIHDPWFLQSVDVERGPSSSLYDNYALGGMVHFRTRRGSDIDGVETFLSGGSYGYQKYAVAVGKNYGNVDVALFSSYQRADGWRDHTQYWVSTVNLNVRFRIDDKQSFFFKVINLDEDEKYSTRLTASQFRENPRQMGGNATTNPVTLGQKVRDRITLVGAIYERQLDADTTLTTEADYHVKDINQPVGSTINPSFKHYTDLRHNGRLFDMPLRSYVGFFTNYQEQEGTNVRNQNDGHGTFGPVTQQNRFSIRNIGVRFREELTFMPNWLLAIGLGYENSDISGFVNNFTATATTSTLASTAIVNRTFDNWAPDVSLQYRLNEGTRIWSRASTGYGIPQFSNMTTGLDGLPGFNASIKPQKNLNVEIGTDSQMTKTFWLHAVGFWTFFKDEIITQSVPTGLTTVGNFAVNAKESQYRGIELGWRWIPVDGFRLTGAYTHMESKYVRFTDQFVVNGVTTQVNQSGHQVPSVEKNVFNMKASYDHAMSGFGGWAEGSWIDSFFVNNNNSLAAPAYLLFNVNLHHAYQMTNNSYIKSIRTYVELDNIFDKAYVGWATPVADSTPDANKQAFFGGYGRAFYAGLTMGF